MLRRNDEAKWLKAALVGLAAGCYFAAAPSAVAVNVVVQLRNGDRLTGELVTQATNHVVINTPWAGQLALPLSVIGGVRTATGTEVIAEAKPEPPKSALAPATKPVVIAATTKTPTPAPVSAVATGKIKTKVELGSNLNYGAKDQELLYGRWKTTYEKPYATNAKKFFRTTGDYSADYGVTEGVRSANRMMGSLKTDFDLGARTYCYNAANSGYDEIRKIDFYYDVGPGMGYHLLRLPRLELDVEGGLNYQSQNRSLSRDTDSLYVRAAENLTWRVNSRISLTKKFEFFVNGDDPEQFRFRLDATASYKLIDNLSFNVTVLDQFDTDPAPKVDQNEVQVRSTIGITF